MATIKMFGLDGSEKGAVDVADETLVLDRGAQAVHDAVVARQAYYRAGTASTLSKGEVNGSNRKPWKQKGTGRARAGLKQSPVWRGGGVAFGPHPRDWSVKLNKKVGRLAFRRVVSDRIADGTLVLAEELTLPAAKTKELAKVLKAFGTEDALLVVKAADDALTLAARNLPGVEVATAAGVGVYQMMAHGKVLVARAAWEDLAKRLEGKQKKEKAQ